MAPIHSPAATPAANTKLHAHELHEQKTNDGAHDGGVGAAVPHSVVASSSSSSHSFLASSSRNSGAAHTRPTQPTRSAANALAALKKIKTPNTNTKGATINTHTTVSASAYAPSSSSSAAHPTAVPTADYAIHQPHHTSPTVASSSSPSLFGQPPQPHLVGGFDSRSPYFRSSACSSEFGSTVEAPYPLLDEFDDGEHHALQEQLEQFQQHQSQAMQQIDSEVLWD